MTKEEQAAQDALDEEMRASKEADRIERAAAAAKRAAAKKRAQATLETAAAKKRSLGREIETAMEGLRK